MISYQNTPSLRKQNAEQAAAWNEAHPVGTAVLYETSSRLPIHKGITTGPAFVLHDQIGGAVVRVDTHTFPVHLDDIKLDPEPIPPAPILALAEALRARATEPPRDLRGGNYIGRSLVHGDWRDHIADARALLGPVYAVVAAEVLTAVISDARQDLAEVRDPHSPMKGLSDAGDPYDQVLEYVEHYVELFTSGGWTRESLIGSPAAAPKGGE